MGPQCARLTRKRESFETRGSQATLRLLQGQKEAACTPTSSSLAFCSSSGVVSERLIGGDTANFCLTALDCFLNRLLDSRVSFGGIGIAFAVNGVRSTLD